MSYVIVAKNWLRDDWLRHFHVDRVTVNIAPRFHLAPHPLTGQKVTTWIFAFSDLSSEDRQRFLTHWATILNVTTEAVDMVMKGRFVTIPTADAEIEGLLPK